MAKNIVKFYTVPYQIGTGAMARTGNRIQLSNVQGVSDVPLCQEVVDAVRLSTSANQLLHDIRQFVKVCLAKSCTDGRPRFITGEDGKIIFKFAPIGNGSVESPTSQWDPKTCRAFIRPQFLANAKDIDATFQNEAEGIGVRLDNVTWVGAQGVVNVVKTGQQIGAYGRHMEFDATAGDEAFLLLPNATTKALTCVSSDVSSAKFSWPAGYAPTVGSTVQFVMKSRGGVAGGEVYVNKKVVTIVA